tara:strand:+ start:13143 stop:13637 length:495 start_codon:yes stop_codon:yes gene_type:complete
MAKPVKTGPMAGYTPCYMASKDSLRSQFFTVIIRFSSQAAVHRTAVDAYTKRINQGESPEYGYSEFRQEALSTFARGLEVIRSFDTHAPLMTLSALAEKNNLSRAFARRFFADAAEVGLCPQDNKNFRLTAKVLELGYYYLASLDYTETITSFMQDTRRGVHHC